MLRPQHEVRAPCRLPFYLFNTGVAANKANLGAGKTTFTKGLALALGVKEEVTSPTFTIMNVYASGRLKLNHLDMYRVENEDELYELGVSESIGENDAVTVIEWNKMLDLDGKIYSIDIKSLGETEREFSITLKNDPEAEIIIELDDDNANHEDDIK